MCSLLSLGKCSQAHRERNIGATAITLVKLLDTGTKQFTEASALVTFILSLLYRLIKNVLMLQGRLPTGFIIRHKHTERFTRGTLCDHFSGI